MSLNHLITILYVLLIFSCNESTLKSTVNTFENSFNLSGHFPRFPHDTVLHISRKVAILYTPDDINSDITWKSIGYPNSGFFMLHQRIPEIKYTTQIVSENRYLGDNNQKINITNDPEASKIWYALQHYTEFSSWNEFGNHGYNHSPKGDSILSHHEFSAKWNPSSSNYDWCFNTFQKARNSYEQIGLNNDKIIVMRFPGYKHTKQALEALVDQDFIAFFDNENTNGFESWVKLANDKQILKIPDVHFIEIADDPKLIQGLDQKQISPERLRSNESYRKALKKMVAEFDRRASQGGIVNIFDHWWESSAWTKNGTPYRMEMLTDAIHAIMNKYQHQIWWPFGSELAKYLHLSHKMKVQQTTANNTIQLKFSHIGRWKNEWATELSYDLLEQATPSNKTFNPNSLQHFKISKIFQTQKGSAIEVPIEAAWMDQTGIHFNFVYTDTCTITIQLEAKN